MEDFICGNCNSNYLEFVKYKMSNGVDILRKQCFNCGFLLHNNYKRNYINNYESLDYVNQTMRNYYFKCQNDLYIKKQIEYKKIYKIKCVFEDYAFKHFNRSYNYYHNVYLKSAEWKHKRDLLMEFYKNKCQKCDSKASDIHHLTYDNIFKEKFKDLIPLCRDCHNKEHIDYATT